MRSALLIFAALALAAPVAAQDTAVTPATDSVAPTHKHGGLFGKAKALAGNKVVRTVVKVAACNVVPGGQLIAGAVDAASSTSAGGAAQSMAGAASGGTCAGTGLAGALSTGAGAPTMPDGMGAATMVGPRGAALATAAGVMGVMAQQMAAARPRSAGTADPTTESPDAPIVLAADLAADLRRGKTVVRNIDWVAGTAELSPEGAAPFASAMDSLAGAVRDAGGGYRLDLYLDSHYEKATAAQLGTARQDIITALLGAAVTPGSVKRDKSPRLELVRTGGQ